MKGKKRWDLTHSFLVYSLMFIVLALEYSIFNGLKYSWSLMMTWLGGGGWVGRLSLTIILYKTTLVNKKLERKSPLPFCCLMSKPRYSFVVFSTGRGYPYHIANKAAGGILNCFSCMTTFRRRVSHLLFIMSFFFHSIFSWTTVKRSSTGHSVCNMDGFSVSSGWNTWCINQVNPISFRCGVSEACHTY